MLENNDLVHEAERKSQIVVIPENLQAKINQANKQNESETIKTMEVFVQEREKNMNTSLLILEI